MPRRSVAPENTHHVAPEAAEDMWHYALEEAKDLDSRFHFTEAGVGRAVEIARSLAATCFSSPFHDTLREAAAGLNAGGNEQGTLLVRGLPTLPNASEFEAKHFEMPDASVRAMGLVAVAVTSLFGPPIGYRKPEGKDGVAAFLSQIAPSSVPNTTVVGTNRAGGWHTEFAGSPSKPSTLVLTGIHPGDAATRFIPAHRVVSHLERTDPVLLEKLREPRYATPTRFITDEKTTGPIITDTDNGPAIILGEGYREAQDPDDEEARAAIEALTEVLQIPDLSVEHFTEPGEAFAFYNMNGLHARPAFKNLDRWFMRAFAGRPGMPTIVEIENVLPVNQ